MNRRVSEALARVRIVLDVVAFVVPGELFDTEVHSEASHNCEVDEEVVGDVELDKRGVKDGKGAAFVYQSSISAK